jgi:hypothetical protein
MTISMGITDRSTGVMQDVPVCTNDAWRRFWLPAAKELCLEMAEALPALWITEEYRDRFLAELQKLDGWASEHENEDVYFAEMKRRIKLVTERVRETSLQRFEVSFG